MEEIEGYRLINKIGEGGMAVVYKGVQISLNRPVAVKVLKKKLEDNSLLMEQFNRESLIIACLVNPYIIHVIDRGITRKGMPYFVMEYIEGSDLQAAIRTGNLDFNRKLDLIIQICKALSYAHKNGVVHRDIKPSNVLMDNEGNAKVLDFGIARFFTEEDENTVATGSGIVMGTLSYMSPEQLEDSGNVTPLSDLYSLGALIYELYTGKKIPRGLQLQPPCEIITDLPIPLKDVIIRCLDPDPVNRPSSADEIKDILLKFLRGAHLKDTQKEQAGRGISNIKDKFALLDIIKEDKYSSVYLYENKADHNLLVIKKQPGTNSGLTEAKLLTSLRHKNIINILGASKNDRFFIIVMEYLSGGSLKDRLIKPLPMGEALIMVREISEGLSFAHKNRITHGNLRPSNILFTETGQVKITDFGLDEHYSAEKEAENWYVYDNQSGSPRSDIFGLGVIFYQMLTGFFPEWSNGRLVPLEDFSSLPVKVRHLATKMLDRGKVPHKLKLDQLVQEIDDILNVYDETAILRNPADKSAANPRGSMIRRIFLIFFVMSVISAAVAAFFVFTDQQTINIDAIKKVLKNLLEYIPNSSP